MKKLLDNFQKRMDNFHKKTFQLKFKNGEIIKLEGYSIYSNKISRSPSFLLFLLYAPIRIIRNNIFYYILMGISLIILDQFDIQDQILSEFYFIIAFQLFAHIVVEIFNKFNLTKLDNKINNQETKILKQWDECINNKALLIKIKNKAKQRTRIEDLRERKYSVKQNNEQKIEQQGIKKQLSQRSRSSGVSQRQSNGQIQIVKPAKSPESNEKLERMNSRISLMSPLIHQDMILKNELKNKLIQDPSVRNFMQKVPCMFGKGNERSKKLVEIANQNTDKVDLIKSIKSQDIQLGDVIIIERNQIAQCDILILYCNDDNFCVQNQFLNYSETQIRKPLIFNKFDSHNLALFKKSFTGTIYLTETAQLTGYFQLKKDPQSRIIGEENILYSSEKLLNTPWIIGVVIKVGLHCRCYNNFKIKQQNRNYSQRLILIIILIYIIYLIIIYILISQQIQLSNLVSVIQVIFQIFVHLLFLLPHSFRILFQLSSIIQQQIMKTLKFTDIRQIKAFHIESYNQIQRVTMNLDTLIEGTIDLKVVITQNKICFCKESEIIRQAETFAQQQSSNNHIFKTADSKENSKIEIQQNKVEQMSSYRLDDDELGSFDDNIDYQVALPEPIGFRMISNMTYNNDQSQPDANLISHQQSAERSDISQDKQNRINKLTSRSSKQLSMRDSKLERKSVFISELIRMLITEQDSFNFTLFQFCLNQISFSKILHTQSGEEKIKNTFMNKLDEHQIKIAKAFGYEFQCINSIQNCLVYLIQVDVRSYNFKLIDTQFHNHSQRLYMLFELEPYFQSKLSAQYILFIRQSNSKKSDSADDKQQSSKTSSSVINNSELEHFHLVHYQYTLLNHEDAAFYLNQQTNELIQLEHEQFIYSLLQPVLSQNITLGFKYNFKQKAVEFIKNIEKSNKQLILYTECYKAQALSILLQTDLSSHLRFIFDQDNEDDLKAYFKKTLSQIQQLYTDQGVNVSQAQSWNKILNTPTPLSQNSNRKIEDLSLHQCVSIILKGQTCQIIEKNTYMIKHMKLLLRISKTILLYNADQISLEIIQDMFENHNQTLNLLFENQSLMKYQQGFHLQVSLLQEFSYFQTAKYENLNKQTFFKNMIQSLKARLLYERCLYNEVMIYNNSEVVVQGFNELNQMLFKYSPRMQILLEYIKLYSFQKCLYFTSFIVTHEIMNLYYLGGEINLILELIFYSFGYLLLIYIHAIINFIQSENEINDEVHQLTLIETLIHIKKDKKTYLYISIKSLMQGCLSQLIFSKTNEAIEFQSSIIFSFLSIILSDLLNLIIKINHKLKISTFISFSLIYFFYILIRFIVIIETTYYYFENSIIFNIILVVTITWVIESLFDTIFSLDIPKLNGELKKMLDFIVHTKPITVMNYQSLQYLQKEVNNIFEDIEQIDNSIQKLLLNLKGGIQNTILWKNQIFQKAQSIMKWKKKSLIQCGQLIFFHANMLSLIYGFSENNYYFIIIYVIYLFLQIIIFLIQYNSNLNPKQLNWIELTKFLLSAIVTLLTILGLTINESEKIYQFFSEILFIFELSTKMHPIYDNKILIISKIIIQVAYLIIFIIIINKSTSYIIITIFIAILFSLAQFIIKGYFLLLEEEQATHSLNFIEESNKINDILGILLPKFIRHRLNETDQYNIHQNQGNCAIVFCDICHFDEIIIEEQENIIGFLDDLFRTFDKYCELYGVQKIETVGKTYMASAGLKACESDLTYLSDIHPVQRAVNLAEKMIQYIRSKTWGRSGKKLIGKIGIHYGRVISGVIGFHKPQFSLIGDTVNTTSRHCSTGLEDRITLSDNAYEQLKSDTIEFEVRYVEMKGLGQKPTYVYQKKGLKPTKVNVRLSISDSKKHSRQNTQTQINYQINKSIPTKLLQQTSGLDAFQQLSRKTLQFQNSWNQQRQYNLSQGEDQIINTLKSVPMQYSIKENDEKISLDLQSKKQYTENISQLLPSQLLKYQLEEYQPEVDHFIEYNQLLNVILLKNHQETDAKLILEKSFLQILKKSYYKTHNNYDEYHEYVYHNSEKFIKRILQIYTLYYLIKQLCLIGEYDELNISQIILQWFGCSLNFISLFMFNKKLINQWLLLIQLQLIYQQIVGGLFQIFAYQKILVNIHILELIFNQQLFTQIQLLSFWIRITYCIFSLIFELFILIFLDGFQSSIFFWFIGTIYNLTYCYYLEEQQIFCFNQKNIFQNQQAKESQLLQYLLPQHILQTFLNDNYRVKCLSDKIDDVTILFADIAGFTEYSSRVSPEEVLLMLKNLFVEFDRKCYELNVYKLYTIGDCYVAFGMIDYNNRNPAEEAKNIVNLGFEMIKIIDTVRKQINFDGLNMRIGLHTGSVFGGVMGTDIVRYDIYGPDVLIANKMESNGKKGSIHISGQTKELLEQDYEDEFAFTWFSKVNLTSINREIEGYLVESLAEDEFPSDSVVSKQIQIEPLNSNN